MMQKMEESQTKRNELSIHQTVKGDKDLDNSISSQSYAMATKPIDNSETMKSDHRYKLVKSLSTTMTFKEPRAILFSRQPTNYTQQDTLTTKNASEQLPDCEPIKSKPVCDSLINNCGTGSIMQPFDETDDMKSNSLHGFAQLAGYLQTRIVPGVSQVCCSPQEE